MKNDIAASWFTRHRNWIFLSLTVALAAGLYLGGLKNEKTALHASRTLEVKNILDNYQGHREDLLMAREMLDSILTEDPKFTPAHVQYARYHLSVGYRSGRAEGRNYRPGSLTEAEAVIAKAIEIDPKHADAYVLAGHIYRLMYRVNDAKKSLAMAETLNSTNPWLDINWAAILEDEEDFEEAEKRYLKVVASNTPEKAAIWGALESLMLFYMKTGRLNDADATFQKQLALEPHNAWSRGNYALFLLCHRDDFDAAIAEARHALNLLDYGNGRTILSAALYRKWANEMRIGRSASAEKYRAEAENISGMAPYETVEIVCRGETHILRAVLSAVERYEKTH